MTQIWAVNCLMANRRDYRLQAIFPNRLKAEIYLRTLPRENRTHAHVVRLLGNEDAGGWVVSDESAAGA